MECRDVVAGKTGVSIKRIDAPSNEVTAFLEV